MYHPPALAFRNSVFCPQYIYVFCVDIRKNSDYFSLSHYLGDIYNRGRECLLCGSNWVFKSDRYRFVLKGLITRYKNKRNNIFHNSIAVLGYSLSPATMLLQCSKYRTHKMNKVKSIKRSKMIISNLT